MERNPAKMLENGGKAMEWAELCGEYRHALDAKNRLFIPAKLREVLGETFVITRKVEQCLAMYSKKEWDKFTAKLNTLPDSVVGDIKRFIYSKTQIVTPDTQGRVIINPELKLHSELDRNAVVIGVGDHAEIWAEELWSRKEASVDKSAMLELLRQLGL